VAVICTRGRCNRRLRRWTSVDRTLRDGQ